MLCVCVMELLSVAGGVLLDSKECVCCARGLDAPPICFVCVFVCQNLYLLI